MRIIGGGQEDPLGTGGGNLAADLDSTMAFIETLGNSVYVK